MVLFLLAQLVVLPEVAEVAVVGLLVVLPEVVLGVVSVAVAGVVCVHSVPTLLGIAVVALPVVVVPVVATVVVGPMTALMVELPAMVVALSLVVALPLVVAV